MLRSLRHDVTDWSVFVAKSILATHYNPTPTLYKSRGRGGSRRDVHKTASNYLTTIRRL